MLRFGGVRHCGAVGHDGRYVYNLVDSGTVTLPGDLERDLLSGMVITTECASSIFSEVARVIFMRCKLKGEISGQTVYWDGNPNPKIANLTSEPKVKTC